MYRVHRVRGPRPGHASGCLRTCYQDILGDFSLFRLHFLRHPPAQIWARLTRRVVFWASLAFLCAVVGAATGPVRLLAQSTETQSFPLEEALRRAYVNADNFAARQYGQLALLESNALQRAQRRPSVSVSGNVRQSTTDNEQAEDLLSNRLALTFRQRLWSGGQTAVLITRSDNLARAGRYDLVAFENDLFLQVVVAYVDGYNAFRKLETSEEFIALLEHLLEVTASQLEVGLVARRDFFEVQSSLETAKATLVQDETTLGLALETLSRLTGVEVRAAGLTPPDSLLAAMQPFAEFAQTPPLDALESQMLDNHPALQAMIYRVEASQNAIEVAETALRPRLDLDAEVSRSENAMQEGLVTNDAYVGLTASFPLYQGGGLWSQKREALLRLSQTQYEQKALETNLRSGLRSSFFQLEPSLQQVAARQAAETSAEESLRAAQEEWDVGLISVADVLEATQRQTEARFARQQATNIVFLRQAQLTHALGLLTNGAMVLCGAQFDYQAYYESIQSRWVGTGSIEKDAEALLPLSQGCQPPRDEN